jgi:hypothetical protein
MPPARLPDSTTRLCQPARHRSIAAAHDQLPTLHYVALSTNALIAVLPFQDGKCGCGANQDLKKPPKYCQHCQINTARLGLTSSSSSSNYQIKP